MFDLDTSLDGLAQTRHISMEDRLAKLEDELGNLKIWLEAYEDDMDATVTEIENRIKYLERFNHDGG